MKQESMPVQSSQNIDRKQSESVGTALQPDITMSSDSLQTEDHPINSRILPLPRKDLKNSQSEVKKEKPSTQEQQGQGSARKDNSRNRTR